VTRSPVFGAPVEQLAVLDGLALLETLFQSSGLDPDQVRGLEPARSSRVAVFPVDHIFRDCQTKNCRQKNAKCENHFFLANGFPSITTELELTQFGS
jgi:hypothetical protein